MTDEDEPTIPCRAKVSDHCHLGNEDDGSFDGSTVICMACYHDLMPYSKSNRLLKDEFDQAIRNYRRGHKPPTVHDPVLDFLRAVNQAV